MSIKNNQTGAVWLAVVVLIVVGGVSAFTYVRIKASMKDSLTFAPTTTVAHGAKQATTTVASVAAVTPVDPTKIPLGDGKVATTPTKGDVMSCTTSFRGGGASHSGAWLGTSTWDSTTKPHVEGSVSWATATSSITSNGTYRVVATNNLPLHETTGIFPIKQNDPAYLYDRNPNSITAQNTTLNLPLNPAQATSPSCVPMGAVGYLTNGVALYNALDDGGRDAVAHEVQDSCGGHPQMAGQYHYHGLSPCIAAKAKSGELVGYALDGYGIYVEKDSKGNLLTNAELDECHGRTSTVLWDGKQVSMYHYDMTLEYPYSIGCFRGSPIKVHP